MPRLIENTEHQDERGRDAVVLFDNCTVKAVVRPLVADTEWFMSSGIGRRRAIDSGKLTINIGCQYIENDNEICF